MSSGSLKFGGDGTHVVVVTLGFGKAHNELELLRVVQTHAAALAAAAIGHQEIAPCLSASILGSLSHAKSSRFTYARVSCLPKDTIQKLGD